MLQLDQRIKEELAKRQKYYHGNVNALSQPVLIILDYSPSDSKPPLSIAFDSELGPKCWMSEKNVSKIGDDGPNPHQDYGEFDYEGRHFYGFSIQALTQSDFDDVSRIETICRQLYAHIVWPDP